jgi:transglutaminase-like putative cysteine protease
MEPNMLSRQTLTLALVCYLSVSTLLFGVSSWLLVGVGVIAGFWRLRVAYGYGSMPKARWVKLLLLPLLVLTVWLVYSMSRFEIVVNLVMLGYSLKFIEIHKARDIQAFCLTGVMLVAFSLVFHLQLGFALLAALAVIVHLLLLLSLSERLTRASLLRLLRWNLAALPLVAALFVIVPRLSPLWRMPAPTTATTGLNDVVAPGDITALVRSDKLVFRAEFTDAAVPLGPWYWRAMALDRFDGQRWQRSALLATPQRFMPQQSDPLGSYRVLVEASATPWVATLSPSSYYGGELRSMADGVWERVGDRFGRRQFEFSRGVTTPSIQGLARQLGQALQVPEPVDARLGGLAKQWSAQGGSARDQMARLEAWFRAQPFRYTLTPPVYAGNDIGRFLFEGRLGFCVHYAQAATVLARLMGVPARMVTGYLGGEWQGELNTVTVREFDAHAWVEYWTDSGWQRLDPTAWVAPDRMRGNLQQSRSTAQEWRSIQPWMQRLWYSNGLSQTRLWLAKVDFWWARWVVNFDRRKQAELMQTWLGHFSLLGKAAVLVSLMALAAFVSLGLLLWVRRPKRSRQQRRLARKLRQLRRAGSPRLPGETLRQFAERLKADAPEHYMAFKIMADDYYQRRFSQD